MTLIKITYEMKCWLPERYTDIYKSELYSKKKSELYSKKKKEGLNQS